MPAFKNDCNWYFTKVLLLLLCLFIYKKSFIDLIIWIFMCADLYTDFKTKPNEEECLFC